MNNSNHQKMSAPIPHYLYKYCSLDVAIKIIAFQKIRFSTKSQFNDPFDMAPIVDIHPNYIAQMAKRQGISSHQIPNLKEKLEQNLLHDGFNTYKILCLSENQKHILMWSHYADSHKGVCLKLSGPMIKKEWGRTNGRFVEKVEYVGERKEYKHPAHHRRDLIVEKIFTPKYKIWKYEKEWRVIDNVSTNQNHIKDRTEKYIDIPKDMIVGCTFGLKVDHKQIKCFQKLCKNLGLNIVIKQARMHKTKYALVYV